jgi:hypothetical protein
VFIRCGSRVNHPTGDGSVAYAADDPVIQQVVQKAADARVRLARDA